MTIRLIAGFVVIAPAPAAGSTAASAHSELGAALSSGEPASRPERHPSVGRASESILRGGAP
jgi:hypothetical protein